MSRAATKENAEKMSTRVSNALPMAMFRRGAIVLALALLSALAALLPAGASAAPTGAAWQITAVPYPNNFSPGALGEVFPRGPGYAVVVRDMGGSSTTGSFAITTELPEGTTYAGGAEGRFNTKPEVFGEPPFFECSGSGRTVVCSTSTALQAGGSATVLVPVDVELTETSPPTELEAVATVEGGGAPAASASTPVKVTTVSAPFDFIDGPAGFYGSASDADGAPAAEAGSHPYQLTLGFSFPYFINAKTAPVAAGGGLKDLEGVLPRGFVVNPNVTSVRCTSIEFEAAKCPPASEIGTAQPIILTSRYTQVATNLYNLVPMPGAVSEFGFEVPGGVFIRIRGHVNSEGEYELSAASSDILAKVVVAGVALTFWGVPSDPSHDEMRGECLSVVGGRNCPSGGIPTERTGRTLLTLPGDCSGRLLNIKAVADSWVEPAVKHEREYSLGEESGTPISLVGCERLAFAPTLEARPTTNLADSPSGLDVNLQQPSTQVAGALPSAPLRDATVTLPQGLTVNPAGADGLGACSEAQIGYVDREGKIRFAEEAQSCPDAAKLGTVSVTTPLLPDPLPGTIYLARPYANPFGSLLAIYLAVEDEKTGVISKLAGRVTPDPQTGQLTATFTENPELPLEDINLHFFGGARATLQTPVACGAHTTTSTLVPWSTPEGADAHPTSTFTIASSPAGGCPTQVSNAPNSPGFTAGTLTPQAGTYSPFVLKVSRGDGTQRIGQIDATLPPGLTGKLAGIPYCSEADIAAARAREAPNQGAAEIASPSCPLASEVGTVTVGAGAGPSPYYVKGHAYLAGPYKGAPLSLVIITPAVAGPFDLGTVVVRSALQVDPETAQITAKSDAIPSIIDGIPLDVRSIAIDMGRPGFTLNPTSCNPMAVLGTVASTLGGQASLSQRFQVGNCSALAFKPKLKIQLKGATKRIGHPALKAVLIPNPGEANIGRAQVNLPHGEFLDQGNLNKTCTKPVLLAGNCPASTIYGKAKAWTPLLEKPLEGNVYLVGGYGYKLPALVADLNGQIRVLLVGKVDSGKNKGIRNTFEVVPDAPVSRFVLEMKGGKKYGLLENSENLCKAKKVDRRAIVRFTGQNGKVDAFKPVVRNKCGHKAKRQSHKKGSSR